MKTGVFFHKEFTNKDWPIIGDKFHNFPMVMERALLLPDVTLFESKPVDEEILLNPSSAVTEFKISDYR
jgi:hypothetical protein